MNLVKELQRLIYDALVPMGGTGGKRYCRYCGRTSFKGQIEHYRVGARSRACGNELETDEHCAVIVMREVIKQLTKHGAPGRS